MTMVSNLTNSLDILEMHGLVDMFNSHVSLLSTTCSDEIRNLRNLVNLIVDPTLSLLDTILYNSIIPEIVMASTFLLVSQDTNLPMVIDTGALRSLWLHRRDFVTFKPSNLEKKKKKKKNSKIYTRLPKGFATQKLEQSMLHRE